jgi:hypothetical protein
MTDDKELIVVDADVVDLGVLPSKGPEQLVERATAVAKVLAGVIDSRKLYKDIQGKKYVMVEGWSTLGGMIGVLPREVSILRHDDGGYEAVVELIRTSDGAVIGRASALCGMDEKKWASGAEYARRSMAVTRATGKAYRLGFSWIIKLAGYEATPAEEIPQDEPVPPDLDSWAQQVGEVDMEFVTATGALKKDAHPNHLVALLNLSPFKPGHKWHPNDTDWFFAYRELREGGARAGDAAKGASQQLAKAKATTK